MPYTPPHQSPKQPLMLSDPTNVLSPSNNPPRSATYLYRQRRSGSLSGLTPQTSPQPQNTSSYNKDNMSRTILLSPDSSEPPRVRSPSLRQSPPPVTDPKAMVPAGAMLSPPESPVQSDDEIAAEEARQNQRIEQQLVELKKAVQSIPQQRSPSPNRGHANGITLVTVSDDSDKSSDSGIPKRPQLGRNRASSEVIMPNDRPVTPPQPESNAVSDTEEDPPRPPPPMVRKKSGEIVRSSLKTGNRRRPVSMPSTPTYPKVVHFDSQLEHVRHFARTEKPSAVSAGSSPVETMEADYYPFPDEEKYEWDISLPNFPMDSATRRTLPVRVERVYLSTDKQNLMGSVAVANISFQKSVVVRFTLDYWRTVSEVTAEYSNDVRRRQKEDGFDRFTFSIGLNDQANLDKKTLFFCVRYSVNGVEYWDNNGSINFQVDFKKKLVNSSETNTFASLSALPRRPVRMQKSVSMGNAEEFRSLMSYKSDKKEVKKVERRDSEDDTAVLPVRKSAPANAFSSRYDFGSSFRDTHAGGASNGRDFSKDTSLPVFSPKPVQNGRPVISRNGASPQPTAGHVAQQGNVPRFADTKPSSPPAAAPSPDTFLSAGRKPPMQSLSYRELLDNYCFYGSNKTSPDGSYTDLTNLGGHERSHSTTSVPTASSQYTLVSPRSPHSPTMNFEMGSPNLRWTPAGSPPSLTTSAHSSNHSSPHIAMTPPYNYQRRRHGGGIGGFAFDSTAAATAIRG